MHWLIVLAAWYWGIRIVVTAVRAHRARFTVDAGSHPAAALPARSVSVCIPARNEARVIADVLSDLLAQDGDLLREIVVVDDKSEDGTGDVAREFAASHPRGDLVRVVPGDGPPDGWMGKQAAVFRGQRELTGEWLLFVDADVRLDKRAVHVALAEARLHGAVMLSWLGQLTTRSFWEHVLMPFIGDLIALATKLHKVNDPAMDDCLANGQFILIRRDAYGTVGGHEAVKSSVIDDVSLGRAVKFHAPPGSLRYRLVYARKLMAVRMYEDLSGIWRGFTKNFFEAAQRKASWMVGLILYLLWMSVLPWVALFGPDRDWAAAAVSLTVAYRAMTWRFSPYPPWAMLLHPVAALLTAGIVADSTLRGLGLRKPVAWKGRPARV